MHGGMWAEYTLTPPNALNRPTCNLDEKKAKRMLGVLLYLASSGCIN